MKNLFAYGTLMCSDIMAEVSGYRQQSRSVVLPGYVRHSVAGEHYPGLIEEEKRSVEGIVYLDLPAIAWQRLDRFEGDMYERRSVTLKPRKGVVLVAETYVVRSAFLHRLEEREWDFKTFVEQGKVSFQQGYRGFQVL